MFETTSLEELASAGTGFGSPDDEPQRFEVSTHAVGALLDLAVLARRPEVAGISLVNRCIDDLLEVGAAPLCFTPCVMVAHGERDLGDSLLLGVEQGCRASGARLLAPRWEFSETGQRQLAGTLIGVGAQTGLSARNGACAGDVLIGVGSTGLHSQGHAFALRVLLELCNLDLHDVLPACGTTVATALLAIHKSYRGVLRDPLLEGRIHALAHIDTGSLKMSLERLLAADTAAEVALGSWPLPPLFAALRRAASLTDTELLSRCNAGLGMVLSVAPEQVEPVQHHLRMWNEPYWEIGRVARGERRVVCSGELR